MTNVAVVILNFNGEKLLEQFLPSVIQHSDDAKIIVVDNGSSDGSIRILKTKFPDVKLIEFNQNFGFCGGYNKALKQLDYSIVVLLNSDVEVTVGWLQSPLQLFERDASIAAVQPKILAQKNKTHFEYAGAGGAFIYLMGHPYCRGRIFNTLEQDNGQYNDQLPVFWASGACLFIRREKYLEAGGLDVDFFAHMEEIDLCWRLHRLGNQVWYDGNSTVYHVGGGTLSQGSPRKTFLNFRNGLTLLVKNLSPGELKWKLPLRLILDWAAALNFLAHGFGGSAWAVLRAHVNFISGLGNDMKKRTALKTIGFRVESGLIRQKMVVVDYFLKGKRTYAELKNPK
jgi:GT2 family glycosyltransferase